MMAVRLRTKVLVAFFSILFLFSALVVGGIFFLIDLPSADGDDAFVVSVAAHDESQTIAPVVREAIDYWNTNGGYPAAYQKRLVFKENASDPDILVRYESSLSCADSRAGGCAPVVSSKVDAERSPKPLVVQLSSTQNENRLMTRRALIHEFGHVLSIAHCEQPRVRMGCPESPPAGPSWTDRRYPFDTTELRVYVGTESAAMEREVDRLLTVANTGEIEGVPSAVSFERVADPWRAHLTIRVTECSGCQSEVQSTARGGPPYGRGIQYLSYAAVGVTAETVEAIQTLLTPFLDRYSGDASAPRRPLP
jgi:hypothetical protein